MHRCRLEWRYSQQKEYFGWNTQDGFSNVEREFTKGQSRQTLSRRESEYYAVVKTTAETLHLQRLSGIFGNADEAPIENRFESGSRHHSEAKGCGPLKHIETRLMWLQAKHEERKLTVIREPTQTNAADGFTKALKTAKYLEWRKRLGMRYDNGDDVETMKREAVGESGRWARVEALHAVPRSVLIATLMQQECTTRRHRWNDWNWLSKA